MTSTLEIEKKIQSLLDKNQQNREGVFKSIVENVLKSKQKSLHRLQEIRSLKKYKLVFIGKFGSGKTTAINFLFDLFYETNDKINELLYTSGGRTTLCKVILKPTTQKHSYFEVKFVSEEELKKQLKIFVFLFNIELLVIKMKKTTVQ